MTMRAGKKKEKRKTKKYFHYFKFSGFTFKAIHKPIFNEMGLVIENR